jgi:hypothetical protein
MSPTCYLRFALTCLALVSFGLGVGHPVGRSLLAQQHDFSKNSTRKVRVQPGPLAAKVGSAVLWRENFSAAMEEARQTGKPVFWYVSTVRGTFMDRKDSIDRYMLAGPFSWPPIVSLLNEDFIPVRGTATAEQQQQYDIKPYVFIEPGFLILDGAGELKTRVDRLSTLHPQWLEHLLGQQVKGERRPFARPEFLEKLWQQFAAGDYPQMEFPNQSDSPSRVEELLLEGMVAFRLGSHALAREKWLAAADCDPQSPLAWKAAAEAEGWGPFVRGFEVFRQLPLPALSAGLQSKGSAAPAGVYDQPQLWLRGTQFLLEMQNEKGAWTDSDYDFGGTDSLPNVHAAVTAIAATALWKATPILRQYQLLTPDLEAQLNRAVQQAVNFVADDKNLNLQDRDELVWAYAYRVRLLSLLLPTQPELKPSLELAVEGLAAIQSPAGTWFHEYPNAFVTATALLAFSEAAVAGVAVDPQVIERGVKALKRERFGNGGFLYSSQRGDQQLPEGRENDVAASAGRMPVGEMALLLHGAATEESLLHAIDRSFFWSEPFLAALKYDDHTSNMGYGGFFIWFDLEKRGLAISRLTDLQTQAGFRQQQLELIMALPEVDGCFIDSHELGRVYGTAMGLISLSYCQ